MCVYIHVLCVSVCACMCVFVCTVNDAEVMLHDDSSFVRRAAARSLTMLEPEVCVCVYIYVLCVSMSIYVLCVSMYACCMCLCVCMYVCMYVCVYLYMYV